MTDQLKNVTHSQSESESCNKESGWQIKDGVFFTQSSSKYDRNLDRSLPSTPCEGPRWDFDSSLESRVEKVPQFLQPAGTDR
ncbi:hypothetical protein DPMN_145532 [Dreissena polymorpha]|uniref:Uncharacterized protein n=1 Tax=Dreissena polymorpha TaxID=45954 RepID=A0A9D4F6W7_DREPO|nr:hypothetical protein DPMN_145532 [Dreissena polymorpha]